MGWDEGMGHDGTGWNDGTGRVTTVFQWTGLGWGGSSPGKKFVIISMLVLLICNF